MKKLMKNLMTKVKEEAAKRKIGYSKISTKLNVTTGMVSNYLNATNRISFYKFMELINLVFEEEVPQKKNELINEFFEYPQKTEYVKEALEWLFVNGRVKQAENLLNEYENTGVIFRVYSLLLRRNQGSVTKEEFYRGVHDIAYSGDEDLDAKILGRIAQLYAILDF
ncbi:AimR family lysis-lysogeny pheromone receptor, partial [Bacillus infantis]|uniref:AimR family lysis-lysogeny pheromone receptor n=1 Tax=Bacillus infantis TaxID=324767 RepID=UPI002FBECB27